jgi:cell division septum initiation protein DivIVA
MDIVTRLQQIQELVEQARSMPLSSTAMVNREELLELIEAARTNLPEEVKQARWVVKDREELLSKARRDGEAIVDEAMAEQGRLVSQQEVVRAAHGEAERIVAEAREQARQLRLEAEDYIDSKLAEYEAILERAAEDLERSLGQIRRGREKLRGMSSAVIDLNEVEQQA